MRVRFLVFLLLVFVLPTGVATNCQAKEETHKWNWLSEADKVRLLESISPAPAKDSDIDRQDIAEVLKVQASRTPDEIASAMSDQHFSITMVTKVLGPSFVRSNFPASFALIDRVLEDESLLNSTLKNRFHRLRPYQEHSEVKPLFQVEQFSYPSGHSSGSNTMATILGHLFPDKAAALDARADSVGHGRIVAGVHYPSDVEEGKKLAKALTDTLLANPAFQKDLAVAMMEVLSHKNGA